MSTITALLDQHISRDGSYQTMKIHEYGESTITVSGLAEDYARLLRRLGVSAVEIYACDRENNTGYTTMQAMSLAADMIATLVADQAKKRGRKFKISVRVIDPYDGTVLHTTEH